MKRQNAYSLPHRNFRDVNKNYPIYNTTFIDDMRSLVEESAQNFPDRIAISYKDNPNDKDVKKDHKILYRQDN